MPDFSIEREYMQRGFVHIAGVDEAGRGPLCGPVFAGAAILPEEAAEWGLNDSKKLSEKRRETLFEQITGSALAWGVGFATPREIDEMNILNAAMLAMNRAIAKLSVPAQLVLIDGNCNRGILTESVCVTKGDSRSLSIAAGSILAKVSRDRVMRELALKYPEYRLEKHKGYPTAEHIALVRQFGAGEIYRKSFLKKILRETG